MQKSVLENIASVNTNLSETPSSTHIQIIDPITHKRTTSSYLKREEVNSVVQSITDSLRKDNKRIVWSYLPKEQILVCTGFYTEHTKTKNGNDYSQTRDWASIGLDAKGEQITKQRIIDEEYLDVDEMLIQYTEVIDQMETDTATRSGTQPQEPIKKEQTMPLNITKTPENMTDVYALKTYVESVINTINKTVKEGLDSVSQETDVAKQIEQIDNVREVLIQKAKFQGMISEIAKTSELIKKIQLNISSYQK